MQVVILSSPSRSEMLSRLLNELNGYDIHIINDSETFGKENFWKRWEQARLYCLASKHDNYLILPDDVTNLDLKEIQRISQSNANKLFTCNVINDGRNECWGGSYFDCGGITNRVTLERIQIKEVTKEWFKRRTSSGVGYQITIQLRKLKAQMYTPEISLCNHGNHISVMHPEERKRVPLIASRPLKIIVGIATFKGRENALKKVVESLQNQCDKIVIYNNEINEDIADNGKFYGLAMIKEPCYYFTCDDDLEYPSNYIKSMIQAIERTGTIVTHHGRILQGLDRSYYRGHKAFRCLGSNNIECTIDVPGTGVTAFRTDYFNPNELHKSKDKRMSDIIFGLEAAKQRKKITLLKHDQGWINQLPIDNATSIHSTEHKKEERQIELSNKIWNLRYQNAQKI